MIEVRFHGRGGLGAVTASEILAKAAFAEGQYPQAFPFFGVERRGAPVTAYLRVDPKPLSVRTAITDPDIVVVLERSLLRTVPVTRGLKPGGLLVLNAPGGSAAMVASFAGTTAVVDATSIALGEGLGSPSVPIVGTAMLGALVGASGLVHLESLKEAIAHAVPKKVEANLRAAIRGFSEVTLIAARTPMEVPA